MRIVARLFLLFTIVTAVELFLLLKLAELTNWWVTVAMIVVPGIVGAWLAKREGAKALGQIREALGLRREPAGAILDGVLVLLAGALLITPGVLTDLAGLLLLVPPVRAAVRQFAQRRIRRAIDRHVESGSMRIVDLGRFEYGASDAGYDIIDAEDIPKPRR